MNSNSTAKAALLFILIFASGCATITRINSVEKEKIKVTGLFGNDLGKMENEFESIQKDLNDGAIISKEEVVRRGFDFHGKNIKNVQTLRGPDAMQDVIGTGDNRPTLSTEADIINYARGTMGFESNRVPHVILSSKSDRFYFNKRNEKTHGVNKVFIFIFKDGILFALRQSQISVNELESQQQFGGNVLDAAIGLSTNAVRQFK